MDEVARLMGADRPAQAKRNVELGYCPCGAKTDQDCDCFGSWRSGALEGLVPITVRSASQRPDSANGR